jgi:O-antigen/teichoic acid export membrane protein
MQGVRRTRDFVKFRGLALFYNTFLPFTLTPHFSLAGASITYSSTTAVSFLVIYYFARGADVVRFGGHFLLRLWVLALVMALIVYGAEVQKQSLHSPCSFSWYTS